MIMLLMAITDYGGQGRLFLSYALPLTMRPVDWNI